MRKSMVDIQSTAAEIRRGKKIEETTGQKYNGLPITMGGRNKQQQYTVEVYTKVAYSFANQAVIHFLIIDDGIKWKTEVTKEHSSHISLVC